MDKIFLYLLNRSTAAGWLILAVMLLRLIMKRTPPWLICDLWGIAAIRLVSPLFPESFFSLIPSPQLISPHTVQYDPSPSIASGIGALDNLVNPALGEAFAPSPGTSVNPLHVWMFFAGVIWLAGFLGFLGYGAVSSLKIRRLVREAVPLEGSVWLCDHVSSPFILGILCPRIYLPSGMENHQVYYVLAHEKAHLRRLDHWWKPFGYLLLSIYWFHPLVWAAYLLFCRDLELACDEKVIKGMDLEGKKAYAHALVSLSMHRRLVSACPLAFGESHVKGRVDKVLHYKKPATWMVAAAMAVCMGAVLCFLTNPVTDNIIASFKSDPRTETETKGIGRKETERKATKDMDDQTLGERDETENKKDGGQPSLDMAVYAAIMEKNNGTYSPAYDYACCDFVMLEMVSGTPAMDAPSHTTICYGWAFYQEYMVSKDGLESVGGCHIPAVLTFEEDHGRYTLKEYWEPRGGGDFVPDIQEKFPEHLVKDGLDSQKFIIQQMQSCYRQAVEAAGLDTAPVISRLLDELCAGPGDSFDPQTISGQQNTQYRELIKYGQYTLEAFIRRFEKGDENGLEGRIMALICEELLQTRGSLPLDAAYAATGQLWYDTLLAHGPNRLEPYLNRD